MSDEMISGEQLTQEQAYAMLDFYCDLLEKQGYEPIPYPNPDARVGGSVYRGAKYDALNEAYWMCQEARKLIRQGRWSKALRWIGFIQGLVWMCGLQSISEIKTHNRLIPKSAAEETAQAAAGRMFMSRKATGGDGAKAW
jgi:hypothetical protein